MSYESFFAVNFKSGMCRGNNTTHYRLNYITFYLSKEEEDRLKVSDIYPKHQSSFL